MTNEELMRGFEMRLKGYTWEKVGEELGYNPGQVYLTIKNAVLYGRGRKLTTLHTNVSEWMMHEGITAKALAERAGISKTAVYSNLRQVKIGRNVAKAICEMSGLTMEQVQYIRREEKENESAEN